MHYDGYLPFNSGVECYCEKNTARSFGSLVPPPVLLTSDIASASFNLLVHFYDEVGTRYHGMGEVLYLEIMHRAKKSYVPKHTPPFYLDWIGMHHPTFKQRGMFACVSQHVEAWTVEEQIDKACEAPSRQSLRWNCLLGELR
jgi:hypothetical protein